MDENIKIQVPNADFMPGDTVYHVAWECNCPAAMSSKRYGKAVVHSVSCELYPPDKRSPGILQSVFRGYFLSGIRASRHCFEPFQAWEVFQTFKEARRATAWLPVPKMDDDTWMAILGDRGLDDIECLKTKHALEEKLDVLQNPWYRRMPKGIKRIPIDDAQLGPCCGNISAVRDILWDAYKFGGIIQAKIDAICRLLKDSGHGDMLEEVEGDGLNKVFLALGVYKTAKELKIK